MLNSNNLYKNLPYQIEMKKQVVFIESYATVMIYKIAKEFRNRGYETVLIRLLEPDKTDKEFFEQAYNKVIDFNFNFAPLNINHLNLILLNLLKNTKNLKQVFKEILRLKPYVIFGRSNPNSPIVFFRLLFRNTPFIYFPYDIHSHWVPTVKLAKKNRNLSNLEIRSEKFNFEKSNGILHKGAPEELDQKYINRGIFGKNFNPVKLELSFPPYCSDEFIIHINHNKLSKKDNQIHVVCLGSGGKRTVALYEKYFHDLVKFIITQKIHFHLYVAANTKIQDDEIPLFREKYKNYPLEYFHVHDALDPKEIIREISKYDYGLSLPVDINYEKYNLDPLFAMGNRVSTFLEAGLIHFFAYTHKFIERTMIPYGLNLSLSINGPNNVEDFSKIIKKLNKKQLEKNILKTREDFNIKKHFPELEKFVEKVVKSKKLNQ